MSKIYRYRVESEYSYSEWDHTYEIEKEEFYRRLEDACNRVKRDFHLNWSEVRETVDRDLVFEHDFEEENHLTHISLEAIELL